MTDSDFMLIPQGDRAKSFEIGTACPLCGGSGSEQFKAHRIPILDCTGCGHRYAGVVPSSDHVEDIYGDDYFFGGGAGYSDYTSEERLLRNAGKKYAKLISRWQKSGNLLDVGSAAGFILQGFTESGWKGTGVEPNGRMVEEARRRFKLDMVASAFENYLPGRTYDVVTMIQVIAHFADPAAALRHAASLLRPGGLLLIESWNYRSRLARLFGKRWHEYSPPSVLHWFTPASLTALAQKSGLQQIAEGRPLKWIDAGHAVGLLGYKLGSTLSGRIVRSFGSVLPSYLPLPYPSEDLFWVVFERDSSKI